MNRILEPVTAVYRLPTAPSRTIVAMLTRGKGPVRPAPCAMARAFEYGAGFALIDGFPTVEGKNRAANLALELGASLLLIEDDVLADEGTWNRALAPVNGPLPVRFATARCRDGSENTRWHADGTPLYSGTPFILLPHPVLLALPKPVFVANDYGIAEGELFLRGPNAKGHHSDVHLWVELRKLEPRPNVENVGRVSCVLHGEAEHDLQNPSRMEVLA